MADLPVSTLRYYNKEAPFLGMECTSGICRFTEDELKHLHVIECQALEAGGPEYPPVQAVVCRAAPPTPAAGVFPVPAATSGASLLMSCGPSAAFTR